MGTVQMLLAQLGLNAPSGSNVTIGGRQYRLMPPVPEVEAAAPGGRPSDSLVGAINATMQSLLGRLMPQQHRLLALPPRVPASEVAALLQSANDAAAAAPHIQQLQQQQQQGEEQPGAGGAAAAGGGGGAAAADAAAAAAPGGAAAATAGLRSHASNMTMLTRLLSRVNEAGAGGPSSLLRDGRGAMVTTRHPATGGMINVAINPSALLSPGLGAGVNTTLLQTLEALSQPGNLLYSGPGGETDRLWDEALLQLMDALGPQGGGRGTRIVGGAGLSSAAGGRAGATGAGDAGGLDPRALCWGGGQG
jgi:hypothetical protein